MSPSVAVWHCPQPPDRVHGHRDDCPAPFMCPLPSVVVWHCPQPPDRIHGHRDDCPAPFMCPLPSVVVWRCPQPPDRVHGHRDDCPAPFMCSHLLQSGAVLSLRTRSTVTVTTVPPRSCTARGVTMSVTPATSRWSRWPPASLCFTASPRWTSHATNTTWTGTMRPLPVQVTRP